MLSILKDFSMIYPVTKSTALSCPTVTNIIPANIVAREIQIIVHMSACLNVCSLTRSLFSLYQRFDIIIKTEIYC